MYNYDGDLLTRVVWSGATNGSVSMSYTSDFRLQSQSVNDANPVSLTYDSDGLLSAVGAVTLTHNAANGLVDSARIGNIKTSFRHDSFAADTGVTVTYAGSDIFDAHDTRDNLGRITALTETVGGQTTTWGYGYDSVGRLTSVQRNGSAEAIYDYDANGNRLRVTTSSGVFAGSYDARDRILTYGADTFKYSPNGDLQLKVDGADTTRYHYSVTGDLLSVRLPTDTLIEYLVDGIGRRVGKKVNGALVQEWLYGGDLTPVAELDGQGQLVTRFVLADRTHVPAYMIAQGHTYRLVVDHRGSVRMVVDVETGSVAQRLEYDAFGRVTLNTNPGFQPFGFAGGIHDEQTGLVRLGARDYDPETGRWTDRDPMLFAGRQANLYAYVGNDPINRVDPSGLDPLIEQSYADALFARITSIAMSVVIRLPFVTRILAVGATGLRVMIRAYQILSSPGFARIQQAASQGVYAAEEFGDEIITYEPDLISEGYSWAEEGFHMGARAFASYGEQVKTVLHELYRLYTSNLIGVEGFQEGATAETQATVQMVETMFRFGQQLRWW